MSDTIDARSLESRLLERAEKAERERDAWREIVVALGAYEARQRAGDATVEAGEWRLIAVDYDEIERLARAVIAGEWEPATWHGSDDGGWAAIARHHRRPDDSYDEPDDVYQLAERDRDYLRAVPPGTVLAMVEERRRLLDRLRGAESLADRDAAHAAGAEWMREQAIAICKRHHTASIREFARDDGDSFAVHRAHTAGYLAEAIGLLPLVKP